MVYSNRFASTIFLAAILIGMCLPAAAEEKLGITVDSTFVTSYIWRGYDVLGERAAWQPSVDFDLYGTGFTFNIWGSMAFNRDYDELDEIDYTLAYGTSAFEEERYAMDIGANYIYYDFPQANRLADTEEVGLSVAFPNLLPLGESVLVPSYYIGRLYPREQNGGPTSGIFHIIGLGYDVPIPRGGGKTQMLSLFADATYNSGAFDADAAWSHATFSASTGIDYGKLTVTPFISYQLSMEDTVNDENELYGGLSFSYRF